MRNSGKIKLVINFPKPVSPSRVKKESGWGLMGGGSICKEKGLQRRLK